MAEHFRDRGYRTGAVVTNPWLQPKWGFARGFERYEFINRGRGPIVNRTGLEMIDGWGRERPFLLYLHYMDVHFPRLPRSEFKQAFSAGLPGKSVYANDVYPDLSEEDRLHSLAVYDACVRSMDELLRELLAGLEQRGLDESTLLVVVADHGDEFGEHGGLGHGRTLYQEMLAVPLQFVHPALGDHARRISEPVSLVDVLPTLLELTGGRVPPGLMGNSLAHLILPGAAHPSAASSPLISELGLTKSIREGDRKLIWFPDGGRFEAYELGLDPTERHALDVERPWVEDLSAKLLGFLARTRPLEGSALPAEEGPGHDELMRSLEALGYVR
jgi:arylsulfatase A-like enzyme